MALLLIQAVPVRLFACSPVRLFACSPVRLFACSPVRLFACSPVRLFAWQDTQQHVPTRVLPHKIQSIGYHEGLEKHT
ncbi:hypothetical protein [Kosakonia quasisacchari]|uniref:hypothetical protein n=1 Tax=Kosakonia quasisacchari TaxID=2529380 RepID=UPI0013F14721|nr:hypothetical protein [Kosakonia quasisacchari]